MASEHTLTSADFECRSVSCPACRRPAKVYERSGNSYLRCTWQDCPINKDMCVPSLDALFGAVAADEAKRERLAADFAQLQNALSRVEDAARKLKHETNDKDRQ